MRQLLRLVCRACSLNKSVKETKNNEPFKVRDFVASDMFVMPSSIPVPAPNISSISQMNIVKVDEKRVNMACNFLTKNLN